MPLSAAPSSRSSAFSPRLFLLAAGLVGGAAGWLLHGALSPAPPALPPSSPSPVASAPAPASPARSAAPPAALSPQAVLERLIAADSTDMVNLVEAIGDLTRLDAAGVRSAWQALGRRPAVDTMGSSAAVIYLWSRLAALGETVAIPRGWGADNFTSTIELVKVRDQLPRLLARLEAGESLTAPERRAVFTEVAHTDPLGAVKLWVAGTPPADFRGDARWLGAALADPATRDATMAELRRWQRDGDLGGATLALATDWIARDPAAVERWLAEPRQVDVRDTVMQQVLNVRVLADPAAAWAWSEQLPESERRRALGMSAAQLANHDPEAGARLVAALQAPAEREEAIRHYGKTLAANNLEQWKHWRDALPGPERVYANQSAFDLWVFHEPEAAVGWLKSQPAGPAKDEMILTLVDVHAVRDPLVAAEWIRSIPDPARRKNAAVAALSSVGPENLGTIRTILVAAGE